MNNEENKTITAASTKELEGLEELSNEELEEVSGGATTFKAGVEYIYDFSILSQAGSSDYVSFASTFNVDDSSNVNLDVKLRNIISE